MTRKQIFLGHLTIDNVIYKDGTKNVRPVPGGAVMYSACGAALWGAEAIVISKMGWDYLLYDLVSSNSIKGIDTSNIIKVDNRSIFLNIEYNKEKEHTFIPLGGINTYSDMAPSDMDMPDKVLKSNEIFHVAPLPIAYQFNIVKKIRERKTSNNIITLDPDVIDITRENIIQWKVLLKNIDILIISMKEFKEFELMIGVVKQNDVFKRICMLKQFFHIKNIVLKDGERGAYLIKENNEKFHMGVLKKKYIDYTGAGDAFAGGFGYALARGWDMEQGLIYGTISSSIAMNSFGYMHMLNITQKKLHILKEEAAKKLKVEKE